MTTATKPRATRARAKPAAAEVPVTELEPVPEGAYYEGTVASVELDRIDVGSNVREDIGDVTELAQSIEAFGVLQPIRVRVAGERFELVYGQRRLAAAKVAKLERIPAIIDSGVSSDTDRTVEQLVENIQRADLNPLEEARAIKAILDAGDVTQAELGTRLGRSQPAISHALRILEVAPEVQERIARGELTASHAKALVTLPRADQVQLAAQAVNYRYSAHDVEEFAARRRQQAEEERKRRASRAEGMTELVAKVRERLPDDVTTIYVSDDYSDGAAAKALHKAGYAVPSGRGARNRKQIGAYCDCTAWAVEIGYNGGVRVFQACVDQAHGQAAWKAQMATDAAERRERDRIQQAVRERLVQDLRQLPELSARVALWSAMDWQLNDWVRKHKGERKRPDAWGELAELAGEDLVEELAETLARGFTDRYGIKLDWPAIAEALGISSEPEPETRKGRKAARP